VSRYKLIRSTGANRPLHSKPPPRSQRVRNTKPKPFNPGDPLFGRQPGMRNTLTGLRQTARCASLYKRVLDLNPAPRHNLCVQRIQQSDRLLNAITPNSPSALLPSTRAKWRSSLSACSRTLEKGLTQADIVRDAMLQQLSTREPICLLCIPCAASQTVFRFRVICNLGYDCASRGCPGGCTMCQAGLAAFPSNM
jgi:hypothetical protein